jgi:hypothetical protein
MEIPCRFLHQTPQHKLLQPRGVGEATIAVENWGSLCGVQTVRTRRFGVHLASKSHRHKSFVFIE